MGVGERRLESLGEAAAGVAQFVGQAVIGVAGGVGDIDEDLPGEFGAQVGEAVQELSPGAALITMSALRAVVRWSAKAIRGAAPAARAAVPSEARPPRVT